VKATASVTGDPVGEGSVVHYDSWGRIIQTDRTGNGFTASTINTFDSLGHLLSITYPWQKDRGVDIFYNVPPYSEVNDWRRSL